MVKCTRQVTLAVICAFLALTLAVSVQDVAAQALYGTSPAR